MLKILMIFLLSNSAFAAVCISSVDAKYVQAIINGDAVTDAIKTNCIGKTCVCTDGWALEQIRYYGLLTGVILSVDAAKKSTMDAAKSAKALKDSLDKASMTSLSSKISDGTATSVEVLQYIKLKDSL